MRLLATHNDKRVVIVQFLYEGEDNEDLKAIYIQEDGEIDVDDVANFTIETHDRPTIYS
jgi:hypothetical protein